MGPWYDEQDLRDELEAWRKQFPRVIVHEPAETASRMWEVSLPESATMAFDSLNGMMRALRMTTVRDV